VLGVFICCGVALGANCGRGVNPIGWQRWVNQGEPYSVAACDEADPRQRFEEKKAELEQSRDRVLRLEHLGVAAKAALEAGLNEEAQSYAEQAIAIAAEPRFKNAVRNTFESSFAGDAVSLGNLVLGRLALARGDVEAAENYLLLSGQIKDGQPVFWGPNMTLARELLKRHRPEAVLKFLEECSHFWQNADPRIQRWAATIRSGKIPDFGGNLVFD
jgi:hypothetical protein